MSSQFKYEIDERNLRLQLKENELSFNEEAWHKFESFSATQKHSSNEAIIKKFHVSLNRNVVLPAVFGIVIIMFSLLLFNFINIKNPHKESASVAPQQAETKVTEVKEPVTPPAQAVTTPVETKDSVATEPVVIESAPKEAETQVTNKAINETPIVEKPRSTAVIYNTTTAAVANPVSTDLPVKKKRRKQELIVTEPTQEEAEQLPPPVSPASSEETPQ